MRGTKEKTTLFPDWFKLENYDTKNFTAENWLSELRVRLGNFHATTGCHGLPTVSKERDKFPDNREWQALYKRYLEQIWARGAIASSMDDLPIGEPKHSKGTNSLGVVQDLSVLMVVSSSAEILALPEYQEHWQNWNRVMNAIKGHPDEDLPYERLWDAAHDVMARLYTAPGDYAYVEVDLNSSLELAVEDFRRWLLRKMENHDHALLKKRFNRSDFSSWHRYRVLPYIDLACWAHLNNKRIPHWALAAALFPQWEGDTVEVIRKTTKKLAETTFTFRTVEVLIRQVHAEKVEKKELNSFPED